MGNPIIQSSPKTVADQWRAEEAIAGYTEPLKFLRELITFPIKYSHLAKRLGLKWTRGVILHGPPGSGKRSLVDAVVKENNAHLTVIDPKPGPNQYVGAMEKILKDAFSDAKSKGEDGRPSVLFIKNMDIMFPHRDYAGEVVLEHNINLIVIMQELMDLNKSNPPFVVVVGATHRINAIDPSLRRFGRFNKDVEIAIPKEEERFQIIKLYTKQIPMNSSVDLRAIAASCNGFVGADLKKLCSEAFYYSKYRAPKENRYIGGFSVTMEDWNKARSLVVSSITKGLTVEIPNVTWDNIGGLTHVKRKLKQAVEWPILHADLYKKLQLTPVRGVLLHGPPGCSKTTLVKAAANASRASFFSLSGADLYSKYVGEGEALLRSIFRSARLAAPSIIFFDEAEVVSGKRGDSSSNGNTVGERLLSTLLTEMDGLEKAEGILVIAATNRPFAIDEALMRPGRFDFILYCPPPDLESRHEILRVHTRSMKLSEDVDLRRIAEETELFTGAELEGLCKEAGMVALREDILLANFVCDRHFQTAKSSLKPALTQAEIDNYSSFRTDLPGRPFPK